MSLEDLDHKEIALLKAALLAYRDCPNCAKEYPRTHSEIVRTIIPKIRRAASRRFNELTSFEEQVRYVHQSEVI